MKIGLACAGGGPGARHAYMLARELEALSLCPEMISCASLPAAPMLLWSRGFSLDQIVSRTAAFLSAKKSERRLARLCASLPGPKRCRMALNSADQDTGVTVIWADGLSSDAWNLKVYPLKGMEKAALRGALSPHFLQPEKMDGMRLCDFSARYGCPFFPLKMAGMERILSVVFLGERDPVGIASESLSVLTGKNADLQYTLRLSEEDGPEAVGTFLRLHKDELYQKLLF